MAEKKIKTRIQQKHDVEANWIKANNSTTPFVPLLGELIIYDAETSTTDLTGTGRTTPITYERFKIGDGKTTVTNLPFSHMAAEERTKLAGIAAGANKTVVDSALSTTSTNPVQNKVITGAVNTVSADLASHTGNTTIHITSAERTNWNAAKTHAGSAHAPVNAQANVQSDWNATSGDAFIKNKPAVIVEGDSRLTDARTPVAHNQASNTITAMTGYSKASSVSAVSSYDSLNTAIGKLETGLDGKANADDLADLITCSWGAGNRYIKLTLSRRSAAASLLLMDETGTNVSLMYASRCWYAYRQRGSLPEKIYYSTDAPESCYLQMTDIPGTLSIRLKPIGLYNMKVSGITTVAVNALPENAVEGEFSDYLSIGTTADTAAAGNHTHSVTVNGTTGNNSGTAVTALTGVKVSSSSSAAPGGHTHSVSGTSGANSGSAISAVNASVDGTVLVLVPVTAAPTGHTHSISITSGTNSGTNFNAATAVAANGTAEVAPHTHTHSYGSSTALTTGTVKV